MIFARSCGDASLSTDWPDTATIRFRWSLLQWNRSHMSFRFNHNANLQTTEIECGNACIAITCTKPKQSIAQNHRTMSRLSVFYLYYRFFLLHDAVWCVDHWIGVDRMTSIAHIEVWIFEHSVNMADELPCFIQLEHYFYTWRPIREALDTRETVNTQRNI